MNCLSNVTLNGQFYLAASDTTSLSTHDYEFLNFFRSRQQSVDDTCCMMNICGLACPVDTGPPPNQHKVMTLEVLAMFVIIGIGARYIRKPKRDGMFSYFVADRSLSLFTTSITLAAQALDSGTILGNADMAYKSGFWNGAVLPIGLATSLVLNGVFLARPVRLSNALTLPDIFGQTYGVTVELLACFCSMASFLFILSGNLVGFGKVAAYLWSIQTSTGIWIGVVVVWFYTFSSGMYSVSVTDLLQAFIGWPGIFVVSGHLLYTHTSSSEFHSTSFVPPSIGFPGYIYPDNIGDDGICDMYNGVPCQSDASECCYNELKWCPQGLPMCDRYDRGYFPTGDNGGFEAMMDVNALAPFPNAMVWNYATIFVLAFGNLGALDFQARCVSSKTADTAQGGCFIAAAITLFVGIFVAYTGSITRIYHGPDSIRSTLEPDSCSAELGLPHCAAWIPDDLAFTKLLSHDVTSWLGTWALVGILASAMSKANCVLLAMAKVFSNNVLRQLNRLLPSSSSGKSSYDDLIHDGNLLLITRMCSLPFVAIAGALGVYMHQDTGTFLIVAFDVALATIVIPLIGAFYAPRPSACAALLSMIFGGCSRLLLEVTLPKEGFHIAPFQSDNFLKPENTAAATTLLGKMFDVPTGSQWDVNDASCHQERHEDYSGIGALGALFLSLIVYVSVTLVENRWAVLSSHQDEEGPQEMSLFSFPGNTPYQKERTKTNYCNFDCSARTNTTTTTAKTDRV